MEVINTLGRRKRAIARVYLSEGKGQITVNNKDYKSYFPVAVTVITDEQIETTKPLKKLKTGEVTEGRYAAGFSFFQKAANSVALVVMGYLLKGVGYVSGAETQTADTLDKLALMTFIVGPILMFLSFFILRKYPITHETMNELRRTYGVEEA